MRRILCGVGIMPYIIVYQCLIKDSKLIEQQKTSVYINNKIKRACPREQFKLENKN